MVHFRFNHSDLTAGGKDTVAAIARTLVAHPEVNVDVVGYTDSINGPGTYNRQLALRRATTVRNLLVAEGVEASRMTIKSRSLRDPIADNGTAAGRAMNRRVEVMASGQ